MKCWVCSREARGWGHSDVKHPIGQPQRYPIDWVFCSRRCQNAFHALYGNWQRAQADGLPMEVAMVDATPLEKAAMHACLRFFGEAAGQIGFDKPLGAYSEMEALQVIEAIVTGYVDEMAAQHERSKFPSVRIPRAQAVSDPMRQPQGFEDPLAGLENDLPWETS